MKALDRPVPIGKVILVGAGPGDPGLITVRGQECLAAADVVLYDALANSQLLQLAPQATCISVGKHGRTPLWSQAEINQRLIELARQGKNVVRLKGGDPAVFARTAEELEVLSEARIPFEVVPGITAALAAASYVGIPITHRRHASAVAFITGQQQAGGTPQEIDWHALANFPGTLVFYMGVTTAEEWTTRLISAGKPADTPAAIIRRCTWSDQTVIRCSLGEVAELLTPATRMRPPVIVVVGQVAELGRDFDWFSAKPLHGVGVLVTRAVEQGDELSGQLREAGADVYHQPTIEVRSASDTSGLDQAISALANGGSLQGITFSSSNGVHRLLERIWHLGYDSRLLAEVKIAVVGPATAAALERFGLRADIIPAQDSEYSAAGLLQQLDEDLGPRLRGQCWLVTTSNRSHHTLQAGLRARGAKCVEALTYETHSVTQLDDEVRNALKAGRIHFATVTSRQVAETCCELLGEFLDCVQPVSFSAAITQRLAELGWPAVAESAEHALPSLIAAVQRASAVKTRSFL